MDKLLVLAPFRRLHFTDEQICKNTYLYFLNFVCVTLFYISIVHMQSNVRNFKISQSILLLMVRIIK